MWFCCQRGRFTQKKDRILRNVLPTELYLRVNRQSSDNNLHMALNSLCYGKQAWHPVWSRSKLPYCSSHLSNRISKANLKGQYLDIHHCRILKIVQKIFHLTIFVTVDIFDTIVRRRELSYRIIRLQNFPEKIYFEARTFFDLTWKFRRYEIRVRHNT